MPFEFSRQGLLGTAAGDFLVEDRRNNPVRGRDTKFRLLQQNMLAYTFVDGVPGFSTTGINVLPFDEVVARPSRNASTEGTARFGTDFGLTGSQIAKVNGDIFEIVEAAIHWNACCWWNAYMRGDTWAGSPRFARPTTLRDPKRQVIALSLPRGYDWVRLLVPEARQVIQDLRDDLGAHDLGLPTSTPDLLIVDLPEELETDARFVNPLADLSRPSQRRLTSTPAEFEGRVQPDGFVLAIAFKKSLRSDRLYQPLYEANIMQLLLEGKLGAKLVEFEVHTLDDAGTTARETYTAGSLALIASGSSVPHRAVRDLYKPTTASEIIRRFFEFMIGRSAILPPPQG